MATIPGQIGPFEVSFSDDTPGLRDLRLNVLELELLEAIVTHGEALLIGRASTEDNIAVTRVADDIVTAVPLRGVSDRLWVRLTWPDPNRVLLHEISRSAEDMPLW